MTAVKVRANRKMLFCFWKSTTLFYKQRYILSYNIRIPFTFSEVIFKGKAKQHATLENSLALSFKTKWTLTHDPASCSLVFTQ